MADPQRTEQPTPRRLEKARKDGQFPVSKEFVSGFVFLAFVWLIGNQARFELAGPPEDAGNPDPSLKTRALAFTKAAR